MGRLLIRRLLATIPVLFFVSAITFFLMNVTPGGPFDKGEGRREMHPEVKKNLERLYNLDKSLPEQYLNYMWNAIQGNLGPSYQFRDKTVQDVIFAAPTGRPWWESQFGRSATLGLMAFLISTTIAVPLGVLAAVYRNSWIDYFTLFLATLGTSLPSFVRSVLLIIVFASMLHWVSIVSNWNSLDFSNPRTWTPWVLPTVALALGPISSVARFTRAQMLEVIRQDYIRTARSKGLAEGTVLFGHALKNAMIPVVTILGPELMGLMTGSLFVETIFQFPGMGRSFVNAIGARDYSMIMGLTLFLTIMLIMGNLLVDILYGWLDPRIKVAG